MHAPFPGTRDGRPFGTFALIWALPDEHRCEIAWIELGADATLRARGRQWSHERRRRYALDYELETSPGYVTERLDVRVDGGPELSARARARAPSSTACPTAISASRRSRTRCPSCASACTRGGEALEIDVAWVSVPDLRSAPRPPDLRAARVRPACRFRSPEADFERVIELTPAGFVLDYPDIARLVTTFGRAG